MAAHPPWRQRRRGRLRATFNGPPPRRALPQTTCLGRAEVPCSGQFASDIINTPKSSASSVAVWWAITGQVQPHSIAAVVVAKLTSPAIEAVAHIRTDD